MTISAGWFDRGAVLPPTAAMSISPKFLIIFDPESRTVRIEGGFILGEYPSREDAERAARLRELKMRKAPAHPPGAR
jgi:hypothetical protein